MPMRTGTMAFSYDSRSLVVLDAASFRPYMIKVDLETGNEVFRSRPYNSYLANSSIPGTNTLIDPFTILELVAYNKTITGLISTDLQETTEEYWQYVNSDGTGTVWGAELGLLRRSSRYFSFAANYSYSVAKGRESSPSENYSYGWGSQYPIPRDDVYLDWDRSQFPWDTQFHTFHSLYMHQIHAYEKQRLSQEYPRLHQEGTEYGRMAALQPLTITIPEQPQLTSTRTGIQAETLHPKRPPAATLQVKFQQDRLPCRTTGLQTPRQPDGETQEGQKPAGKALRTLPVSKTPGMTFWEEVSCKEVPAAIRTGRTSHRQICLQADQPEL